MLTNDQLAVPQRAVPAAAPAPVVHETPPPAHDSGGGGLGGFFDKIGHVAASGLGAVEHAGAAAAGNLVHGVNEQRGPALNGIWNHLFGGPTAQAGDGRPLTQNHIGTQSPGPVEEGGAISNLMRDTPYLGDYWQALSVTHDSERIQNRPLNGLTSITDVALPGPLMGLVDAPFRAFGKSLFLDQGSLAK